MIIYDLFPRGPLHVGEFIGIDRESVREHIPADTLFAALVSAWAQQLEAIALPARLADCAAGTPPSLRISSAFPRAREVRFYPMPIGVHIRPNAGRPAWAGKAQRRVRWVSAQLFQRLLAHAELGPMQMLHEGQVWISETEQGQLSDLPLQEDGQLHLWRRVEVPHVTVDRTRNASNLFHSGRIEFNAECGLWFAAQGRAEALGWVQSALQHLQDSGLGGLRSTGHGAFEVATKRVPDLAELGAGEYGVLLSRYAPHGADEIRAALTEGAPNSAYALDDVGGWCNDDTGKAWRRKRVQLVREGSCVGAAARGHWVDVMPDGVMKPVDRPVYRYGVALLQRVDVQALGV